MSVVCGVGWTDGWIGIDDVGEKSGCSPLFGEPLFALLDVFIE